MNQSFDLLDKYDKLFDKHDEDSDISKINSNTKKFVKISQDTYDLISASLDFSSISNGAFDITISPIVDLWDINNNPHVPSYHDIKSNLKKVNYKNIVMDNNKIKLTKKNASIDLGAIAKGYVADKLKTFLTDKGVSSGIINLGGNILTIGNNNNKDFVIGIKKPFGNGDDDYSAKVSVSDMSVVTSGVYERYFKQNGKIYHHIMNPSTGYPVKNNLYSVTIISDNSTQGDALSTTCFVLGLKKGLKLINSYKNIYAVFITNDYKIHLSDGLIMDSKNNISIK
jgi:thiamine biosynthesis lipoprotein